jgi:hypothetical protein
MKRIKAITIHVLEDDYKIFKKLAKKHQLSWYGVLDEWARTKIK